MNNQTGEPLFSMTAPPAMVQSFAIKAGDEKSGTDTAASGRSEEGVFQHG